MKTSRIKNRRPAALVGALAFIAATVADAADTFGLRRVVFGRLRHNEV
jgi:hypothetical protein